MGHPSFSRANYGAQQNTVTILPNDGEKCPAKALLLLGLVPSAANLN